MIIGSSQITMGSARSYVGRSEHSQVLGWAQQQKERGELSAGSQWSFRDYLNSGYSAQTVKRNGPAAQSEESAENVRRRILMEFLMRIHAAFEGRRMGGFNSFGMGSSGYTVQERYYYEEREETSFSTTGKVRTADGREIDFALDLSMSRSFTEYCEINYQIAPLDLCDPFVINLDEDIAQVSDQKMHFDLDADGSVDEISRLGAGSGYLALDQNGDGRINDGSELFGTKSGDGFRDLAAYDSDGNGWIDEADPIFDRLKIWVMDEKGRQRLYRLKDKGVGAICLSNVDTSFDLKAADSNTTNARIRKSGVFLYENGRAGTVQHVDMNKFSTALRA